jgi:hypothetical protein
LKKSCFAIKNQITLDQVSNVVAITHQEILNSGMTGASISLVATYRSQEKLSIT